MATKIVAPLRLAGCDASGAFILAAATVAAAAPSFYRRLAPVQGRLKLDNQPPAKFHAPVHSALCSHGILQVGKVHKCQDVFAYHASLEDSESPKRTLQIRVRSAAHIRAVIGEFSWMY